MIVIDVRKKAAILCLMLGMFFNPLGFDVLFKMVLNLTGDYWTTDFIFYSAAVIFFVLYFYFSGINPFKNINSYIRNTYIRLKK